MPDLPPLGGASHIGYALTDAGRRFVVSHRTFCDLDEDIEVERIALIYFSPAFEAGYRGERLRFPLTLPTRLRPKWRAYLLEGRSCRATWLKAVRRKAQSERGRNARVCREGKMIRTADIENGEYAGSRAALAALLAEVRRSEESDALRADADADAEAAYGLTTSRIGPSAPPRPGCRAIADPGRGSAGSESQALRAPHRPCDPSCPPRQALPA